MSLCRSASQANQFVLCAVESSDRMRVDEWHERFLQPYLRLWSDASQRESITEVLYLTDISVPHLSHRQLRRAIPLLADCDETGALTLNYFIHAAHGPHIAAPDVEALLYLSPPTNGWILTPAHYDGLGTQTSVHAVLFGGRDQHNLVYTFPVRRPDTRSACLGLPRCVWCSHSPALACCGCFACQGERSAAQERLFRQAVGIAPVGTAQVSQHYMAPSSLPA